MGSRYVDQELEPVDASARAKREANMVAGIYKKGKDIIVDIPWDQVWVAIVLGLEAFFRAALRGAFEMVKGLAAAGLFCTVIGWVLGGWALSIFLFDSGWTWTAMVVGFSWLATWGFIMSQEDDDDVY